VKVSDSLSKDEETEIWETLQVLSTPSKFMSLLRSVWKLSKDDAGSSIFDMLRKMQERVVFLYLQKYWFPGQGSETELPFIFKMLVKGHGSGLDLLKRTRPGEDLDGTWVMFDVMHQIKDGWLTLSAHVYDHHYCALCTIFTCELKAENQQSCKIAWMKMFDVAQMYGVCDIHIHGFMADNAAGGWNAVKKVFFGSIKNPAKERTDAFHWRGKETHQPTSLQKILIAMILSLSLLLTLVHFPGETFMSHSSRACHPTMAAPRALTMQTFLQCLRFAQLLALGLLRTQLH
jgi:hypothetical protein